MLALGLLGHAARSKPYTVFMTFNYSVKRVPAKTSGTLKLFHYEMIL